MIRLRCVYKCKSPTDLDYLKFISQKYRVKTLQHLAGLSPWLETHRQIARDLMFLSGTSFRMLLWRICCPTSGLT